MKHPIYIGFPPFMDESITIGVERLADCEEALRVLHGEHYAETETLYLETPFDPDYQRYKELEARQQFVLFTVRNGLELVGYLQYYVFRDLHTQGVYQAREDAFFLNKKHRGHGIAPKLLSFAESCLCQLGCRYVGMSSKAPVGGPDIGNFLEHRDYRPVAMFYVKDLEK
jgi:GNAT superfamily N-acetyltransferase